MTATNDADRRIRDHLAEGPTVLPERTYTVVRAGVEQTLQRVAVGPVLVTRPTDAFRFSIVAAAMVVVGIVAFVAVNLVPRDGFGRPVVSGLPSASLIPTSRPDTGVALPPEGTTPSDPTPGTIAASWSGFRTTFVHAWVYEDGRMITSNLQDPPVDAGEGFVGFHAQQLTRTGVEFVRSEITATRMFETDFQLARGNGPYLEIVVRNGDRLVRGTVAWQGITGDASTPTPQQANTLSALTELLVAPASWPATAWEDPVPRAYVPSAYAICLGVRLRTGPGEWARPFDQDRVLAVLPGSAGDLLRAGEPIKEQFGMHDDAGCIRLTTDAARELARTLDEGDVTPRSELASSWLGYRLEDPRLPEHEIWIQFAPVLPHGEAVWLGPG